MKRHVEVWINGVEMRDADPRVVIQQFRDGVPEVETVFGESPWRDGQRFIARRRLTKEIQIAFQIRELYDMGKRQEVLDAVNAWAQDGILETNVQPGKFIRVIASGWATQQSARDAVETYTVTFTAASPYWEESGQTTQSVTGTASTGTIINGGTAQAPVKVTVMPESSSATVTAATLTVGDSSITLQGIAATQSAPLVIDYDERGFLGITVGTTSALSKRTAASADDLMAIPGANTIGLAADVSAEAVFSLRGRYK